MQGRGLLSKMTELKDVTSVTWKESGAGEDFRQLCVLLKGNAIPARELNIYGMFQFINLCQILKKRYDSLKVEQRMKLK